MSRDTREDPGVIGQTIENWFAWSGYNTDVANFTW